MSNGDLKAAILACGAVDEVGIWGTAGRAATWQELEMPPPGTGRTLKVLFDKVDATFRRIDMPARVLVLACEAAGIERVLTPEQRNSTAICIETDIGSLATDLAFQESLADEVVHAGIFPYSLTSTSLGEVALRYKLRGPTVSVSVDEGRTGESLREALRMLAAGDVPFVVAGVANTLHEGAGMREAMMRGVVVILGPGDAKNGIGELSWADTDVDGDPFARLVKMCR